MKLRYFITVPTTTSHDPYGKNHTSRRCLRKNALSARTADPRSDCCGSRGPRGCSCSAWAVLPLKTLSPHRITRDSRESSCSKISLIARSRRARFGGCPNSPSAVRRVTSSWARAIALSLTACVGEGSDIAPRRRRDLTAPTSTGKTEVAKP